MAMARRKARHVSLGGQTKRDLTAAPSRTASTSLSITVCLLLTGAVVAIYGQTLGHGYVAYDDDQYVYENQWVKSGLTFSNAVWAFTTFFYANWHPLTWISYMLDSSWFGSNAGAPHLENAAIHLASGLLLFLALSRATRQFWRSAVVAAIFLIHPLHVESVAWISERKDVLSTVFEMLTVLLYFRYTTKPNPGRYLAVVAAFACSLLSKPMAVTLPFVLLLLDYWPLGRLNWPPAPSIAGRLLLEKAPLLAMTAVAAILTTVAQSSYGAVMSVKSFPIPDRFANAVIAYVLYMGKFFWPAGLAVLYPARPPNSTDALLCLLLLAAITAAAWFWRKRKPYLAVGWLWYLGMLVPVIGLVQVGVQTMADRYTYVPSV